MSPSSRVAPWLVVGAALCWSLLGVWGLLAQGAGVGPVEIGFWRAVIAGGLFFAHALLTKAQFPTGRDLLIVGGFGLIGVSLFYSSYQVSVGLGGASLAVVLLYTAPAFVAVLSWTLLKERLRQAEIAAVGTSVLGIVLVSISGGDGVHPTPAAVLAGLTAGLSYALYYPMGRRYFQRYSPTAVLAVMMAVGALGLLPLTSRHPTDGVGWLTVVGMGMVCTYAAYLLHGLGLRSIPATQASVIASVEPVAAAALAALMFGERFAPLALAGAVLVVLAAAALGVGVGTKRSGRTPENGRKHETPSSDADE